MKDRILKHSDIWVSLLAVICLYAIFQIKFDFAFFIGTSKKADAINEIITNLSYSYLAGYIFYFLTVTLPNWKMKSKLKSALFGKIKTIESKYRACLESVVQLPETLSEAPTQEEIKELFKQKSYMDSCRLAKVGEKMTIASYIKESHEESVRLATQLLEYKPWLSSDAIAQIEKVRNSDLSKVIIAITIPKLVAFLDNEDTREKLGIQVFGLWSIIRNVEL